MPARSLRAGDGDGDRMGRHLTALHDGRVVLTFGQAHDPNGVWYNVSPDGVHWDPAKSTRVMEEVGVLGRYQGPRTAQLDAETLATVTSDTKGGVSVILTPLNELA